MTDRDHPDHTETGTRPMMETPDQATHPKRSRHEHWLMASLVTATIVLTAAIAPGFAQSELGDQEVQRWVQPLSLPQGPAAELESGAPESTAPLPVAPRETVWHEIDIQPGQTMGAVFASLNLSSRLLHAMLQEPSLRGPLSRIRTGQRFSFEIDAAGDLRTLRFERDEASFLAIHIEDDGRFREEVTEREIQHRVQMAGAVIDQSLVGAAAIAGIDYGTVLELAKVFGYDIDFTRDLRLGDRFEVVYEEVYRDGVRLRSGDIIAARFVNQGKAYHAFRYTFADGRNEYFDLEGRPMKKSFLRVPVEFTRISSQFTTGRKHPILGTMRAHRGVDYAARSGTPIMAAGDGRVSFAGWQNGYGRTVIIDHGRGYTTLYAHMSRLGGYKVGARVRQGNTIGYVGMTGLATGPHLHYEFRIKGAHRDPLKVTLPKPEPLPRTELARFQQQTAPLLAKLDLLDGQRRYAAN